MSLEKDEFTGIVDPWTDALSVISVIDQSIAELEYKYERSFGRFDSLSDYASTALFVRNLASLTNLGDETLFELSKHENQNNDFTVKNSEFAIQGYVVALRGCLNVSRKRKRVNDSPVRYFPALMKSRLVELQQSQDSGYSVSELLDGGVHSFVHKFMPEPPKNDMILREDDFGISFSNRWAYKLGYLQPMSTLFGLMIQPETYFELVDKPERWEGKFDPESIDEYLDISALPIIDDI